MVEQTSNHNWDIPSVGGDSNEWGTILNDLFDGDLDRDVVLKGTYANRPAAGTDTVTLYLATDRRIVYYNDGSSWEAVYGLGTEANPVPGTSHFESINTDKVGITDFDGQVSGLDGGVQSIPNNSETKIQFGATADQDPFSEWDSSNYEIVARTGGRMLISVSVNWDASSGWSTGDSFGFVPRINDSPAQPRNVKMAKVGTDSETKPPYVQFYEVAEGDRVQINALQIASDGNAKNIQDKPNETMLQWATF
jgi:hypothetical protein